MGLRLRIPGLFLAAAFAAGLVAPAPAGAAGKSGAQSNQPGPANAISQKRRATTLASFVPFDTIEASVFAGHSPRGFLMVDIGLDVPDATLRARVEAETPRLRDAYVRTLTLYASTAVDLYAPPDIPAIVARLQSATDRTLGEPGARVLIWQTMVRATR